MDPVNSDSRAQRNGFFISFFSSEVIEAAKGEAVKGSFKWQRESRPFFFIEPKVQARSTVNEKISLKLGIPGRKEKAKTRGSGKEKKWEWNPKIFN
ncbi:hypothetical protein Peur_068114 [Populus x canadensis]